MFYIVCDSDTPCLFWAVCHEQCHLHRLSGTMGMMSQSGWNSPRMTLQVETSDFDTPVWTGEDSYNYNEWNCQHCIILQLQDRNTSVFQLECHLLIPVRAFPIVFLRWRRGCRWSCLCVCFWPLQELPEELWFSCPVPNPSLSYDWRVSMHSFLWHTRIQVDPIL